VNWSALIGLTLLVGMVLLLVAGVRGEAVIRTIRQRATLRAMQPPTETLMLEFTDKDSGEILMEVSGAMDCIALTPGKAFRVELYIVDAGPEYTDEDLGVGV
jgi:hypothetical protein